MKPQTLLTVGMFVFAQLATASGVYAAIRSDLRENAVRISIVERDVERLKDKR